MAVDTTYHRWVVLFGCAFVCCCVDGYMYALGLPKAGIEGQYPEISPEIISLLPGFYSTLFCFFSPLGMCLKQTFGFKKMLIATSAVKLLSCLLSFVNHWICAGFAWDLVFLAIIPGFCGALIIGPGIMTAMPEFPDHKELATAIITCGTPFGTMIYGFMYTHVVNWVGMGWRGSVLFDGFMIAVMLVFAILFNTSATKIDDHVPGQSTASRLLSKMRAQLDTAIWNRKNFVYYWFLAATSFSILGFPVPMWVTTGQSSCYNYGVPDYIRRNLLTFWGVANLIGRILSGLLSHFASRYACLTSFWLYVWSFLLSAAVAIVMAITLPFGMHFDCSKACMAGIASIGNSTHSNATTATLTLVNSTLTSIDSIMTSEECAVEPFYVQFIVFMIIYALVCAPFITLRSVFLEDIFYPNRHAADTAFAWKLLGDAAFAWIGFFTASALDEKSDRYPYIWMGGVFIASALCMLPTYRTYFRRREVRILKQNPSSASLPEEQQLRQDL